MSHAGAEKHTHILLKSLIFSIMTIKSLSSPPRKHCVLNHSDLKYNDFQIFLFPMHMGADISTAIFCNKSHGG